MRAFTTEKNVGNKCLEQNCSPGHIAVSSNFIPRVLLYTAPGERRGPKSKEAWE